MVVTLSPALAVRPSAGLGVFLALSALPLRPLVADRRLDAHDTGDAALPLCAEALSTNSVQI